MDDYLLLLRIFHTSMEEKAAELERFYAENDVKNYTIKVHALKSSARIIGANGLGEWAQKLEDAGKSGDIAYIRENHAAFIKEYMDLREPLSAVFHSETEEQDKPEADSGRMKSAYGEIHSAAEDMDCDRLETVFAEMDGYSIPAKDAELWKKLKDASDNYDYEVILRLLDE